jgi:hypothetical protein
MKQSEMNTVWRSWRLPKSHAMQTRLSYLQNTAVENNAHLPFYQQSIVLASLI